VKKAIDEIEGACSRRYFLQTSAFVFCSSLIPQFETQRTPKIDVTLSEFNTKLSEIHKDPNLADPFRQEIELVEALEVGLERAPIRARKSSTMISSRASDLIVWCEVTSEAFYRAHYESPTWPHGKSGITIGIGYDIGYVTPPDLEEDWKSYLETNHIKLLTPTCGHTGGGVAAQLAQLRTIRVDWAVAKSQFLNQSLPRYVGATEAALPNTSMLGQDSLGALVSLVYNRGASFSLSGPRYEEMRNIKGYMGSRDFGKIPAEIRCMKRLWKDDPDLRGLLLRRDAEASLFKFGLHNAKAPVAE
jgi:hypothetical protein